uniref:Uncharacterized protein n=1 Tax=Panagrolaimus davidi TaxID=227884 RepID=A0A914Q2P3_9BILA
MATSLSEDLTAKKYTLLSPNTKFLNLNICKNGHYSFLENVQSKTKSIVKEKITNDLDDNNVRKSWSRRSASSDKQSYRNGFLSGCSSLDDSTTVAKPSEDNKSNSTLSLHITAYEDQITTEETTIAKSPKKKLIVKPWERMLIGRAAESFEFPRQMHSQPDEPELMGFSSSQVLLNPNGNASSGKRMNKWLLTPDGWKNFPDVPSIFQEDDVHTFLSFRSEVCVIPPIPQNSPTIALTIDTQRSEIEFQRDSDSSPVVALLCSVVVMNTRDTDEGADFSLKVHCQVGSDHLEFSIPHDLIAFADDEQPPDLPEDLVKLLIATDVDMVSSADPENHVTAITPAQEQIQNLLVTLKQTQEQAFSSPTRLIATNKLHHNLTVRGLCPTRINELRSLIESKKLDLNNVVFHVISHPTIPDNYEIAKGNQTFAAYLVLRSEKKPVPASLKCKVYESTAAYGVLEIALAVNKIAATRKALERNGICREAATKSKSTKLKDLFKYFFPADEMPKSFSFLLSLPVDDFQACVTAAKKFTNGQIRFSKNKPLDFAPAQYKSYSVKALNSEQFWMVFCRCYRQNIEYAKECLSKLSLTYCIDDALNDLKKPTVDFQQQLKVSGVQYAGTLEDAIAAFELPSTTTLEQAHFLLTNRSIQKQLTRTPNFSVEKAKANIQDFLKNVNSTVFEHVDEIVDLQQFGFIVCFGEFDWEAFSLPGDCLILDFHFNNSATLGQDIPVAWNIQFTTKDLAVPENGNLPLRTLQTRIFKVCEGFEKDDNVARSQLQDKAVEKTIKLGNIMDLSELPNLFKFAEDNSTCLFIEPPLQSRFKEVLRNVLAKEWQKKAEVHKTPAKPRGKKRSHPSNSTPPSQTPQPPAQSANPNI